MKKIISAILSAVILICTLVFPVSAAEALKLNVNNINLGVGESYTLKASGTSKTITWTSSNTAVVTVSGGIVKAKKVGTATVTAKAGSSTASVTIKVKKAPTEIKADLMAVEKGKTMSPPVTIASDSASKSRTLVSSNPKIAKVETNGKITGVKAGTCKITVTTYNGKSTTFNVIVIDREKLAKEQGDKENFASGKGKETVFSDDFYKFIRAKLTGIKSNGDGRTPYKVAWLDGANGLLTFTCQTEVYKEHSFCKLEIGIYHNGFLIGAYEYKGSDYDRCYFGTHIVDLSEFMKEDGEYIAVLVPPIRNYENEYKEEKTGIVKSPAYRKGAEFKALDLPIRSASTVAYSRAVKPDNTLWNWTSGKTVKEMDNVKSVKVFSSGAAVIKTDGSLWTVYRDEKYKKVLDNVAYVNNMFWVITNDGALWMLNEYYDEPVKYADNVVDIAGGYEGYILKKDGVLYHYKMGSDCFDMMKTLDNVVSIAHAGIREFAAVKADGTLWYWDYMDDEPYYVTDNIKAVYSGSGALGILRNDKSLWMWGDNDYGKLGTGDTNYRSSPVRVLENVIDVALTKYCTVALTADGTMYEWGLYSGTTPQKVMSGVKLP